MTAIQAPFAQQMERHRHNCNLIMATQGLVTLHVGGEKVCGFDAYRSPSTVLAELVNHPKATAQHNGKPLLGFCSEAEWTALKAEQLPEPVDAAPSRGATDPPTAAKAETPPLPVPAKLPDVPLKKPKRPPARVAPATSLNEFIGPNGHLMWPDVKKTADGNFVPKPTCANTSVAIMALQIDCRYDEFHGRLLVGGQHIEQWAGELSDHGCHILRVLIRKHFGFDPGRENVHDAAVQLCLQNRFDPVVDYLGALAWDGKARLDTWLIDYLGAEDAELNRVIGRLVLIAAVRRARAPGTKFDQILVLEGREGTQKSTAIAVMAGQENFSDQTILGLDEKRQMELIKGRWLYEVAELAGMKRSEVEAVKSFTARSVDRGRPAYGRHVVDQPRRCIFIGTTNDDSYLKSQTGNRRFWPVKTGKIAINALQRDRDQLWAEAAKAEAAGDSIQLPERLWGHAAAEQDKRLEHDPWDDILEDVHGEMHREFDGYEERVASKTLISDYLKIAPERQTKEVEKKLAQCMRRLGWSGPRKMRISDSPNERPVPQRGYFRPVQSDEQQQRSPPWRR